MAIRLPATVDKPAASAPPTTKAVTHSGLVGLGYGCTSDGAIVVTGKTDEVNTAEQKAQEKVEVYHGPAG